MFSSLSSAAVYGIEARIIRVEADVSDGLPVFNMVGVLASEVKEAKDRVRTALKNSDYALKPKHITVNLSPADIRKAGTGFDLPIALSVLAASDIIPEAILKDTLVVGELSLDGCIKPIPGVLPIVLAAREAGCLRCIVPEDNALEGAVVKGIEVIGVASIRQTISYLKGELELEAVKVDLDEIFRQSVSKPSCDFADVAGQLIARRAVEVAVSGLHNILLSGPPGAGKTMLAKRIPGIMPLMSFEESLEVSRIYSTAGKLDSNHYLVTERPFCSPHHSATLPSVIGGGYWAVPGAVSLSHNGVLFLDELPEFNREVIEGLRQPLEDRKVSVSRLNSSYTYPAGFMLVASMNPCPCGNYPDRKKCTCSLPQIIKYRSRISQPILDRIDLCINVEAVGYKEISNSRAKGESTAAIRARVERTHLLQAKRYEKLGINFNSELNVTQVKEYCRLGKEEKDLMEDAYKRFSFSARGYYRVLKVARTIADMDESEDIKVKHLAEAISYREFNLREGGEG